MEIREMVSFLSALAISSGALVWILRTLFSHLLSKDLTKFKQDMEAKHDLEIERLRNDLEKAAFEHRTRFAKLHEERAQVIVELYRKLQNTGAAFERLISPLQWAGTKRSEQIKLASDEGLGFFAYFHQNKIFLDPLLCTKIESLNEVFNRTWSEFVPGGNEEWIAKGSEHLRIWSEFREKVPPLLTDIENRFRNLLGVDTPT